MDPRGVHFGSICALSGKLAFKRGAPQAAWRCSILAAQPFMTSVTRAKLADMRDLLFFSHAAKMCPHYVSSLHLRPINVKWGRDYSIIHAWKRPSGSANIVNFILIK